MACTLSRKIERSAFIKCFLRLYRAEEIPEISQVELIVLIIANCCCLSVSSARVNITYVPYVC